MCSEMYIDILCICCNFHNIVSWLVSMRLVERSINVKPRKGTFTPRTITLNINQL